MNELERKLDVITRALASMILILVLVSFTCLAVIAASVMVMMVWRLVF